MAFFVVFLGTFLGSGGSIGSGVTGVDATTGASATTLGQGSWATVSARVTSRRFHHRNPDTAAPTSETKSMKRFMS